MNICSAKVLFLHGLDSSKESTKFHTIEAKHKFCIDVDYRNLNYATVASFYDDMIEKIRPDIIVGHSLGGYWALKMSLSHEIPCVVANPSLAPNFREDYPHIRDEDLDHDIPQIAYLELGDEVLDMHAVQEKLENYMQIKAVDDGHHRLLYPENLNVLIEHIEEHFLHK